MRRILITLLSLVVLLGFASGLAYAQMYKEAPVLTEMVNAGKLPSVDKRLPKDPLVVDVAEGIGKYGGTMRMGEVQQNRHAITSMIVIGLFSYNQDGSKLINDIAKSFKWENNFQTLTFGLREGHRWSDGAPFTTDDIMFWWEDFAMNTDLNARPPGRWRPGGKPADFIQVSPTVVRIEFAAPNPTVMDGLGRAAVSAEGGVMLPKHYMKQWHPKYNPKANDLAKSQGFEDWTKASLS